MKILLILLVGLTGCCHGHEHERLVVISSGPNVFTVCVNGIEYVKTALRGGYYSAITLSVNKDGKPIQCNY